MGQILALKPNFTLLVALMSSVMACSVPAPQGDKPLFEIGRIDNLRKSIEIIQGHTESDPQFELEEHFTLDELSQLAPVFIYAKNEDGGQNTFLDPIAVNERNIVWQASTGQILVTRNGLLIYTRGLEADLISADVTGVRAAIRAGTGHATRRHQYLGPSSKLEQSVFTCTYTTVGPTEVSLFDGAFLAMDVRESCKDATRSFENVYLVDPQSGTFHKSYQWVSGLYGRLEIALLPKSP
ncbi:MAG: YjbF family lipoprotein [Pseudomonadota bacterium]